MDNVSPVPGTNMSFTDNVSHVSGTKKCITAREGPDGCEQLPSFDCEVSSISTTPSPEWESILTEHEDPYIPFTTAMASAANLGLDVSLASDLLDVQYGEELGIYA